MSVAKYLLRNANFVPFTKAAENAGYRVCSITLTNVVHRVIDSIRKSAIRAYEEAREAAYGMPSVGRDLRLDIQTNPWPNYVPTEALDFERLRTARERAIVSSFAVMRGDWNQGVNILAEIFKLIHYRVTPIEIGTSIEPEIRNLLEEIPQVVPKSF